MPIMVLTKHKWCFIIEIQSRWRWQRWLLIFRISFINLLLKYHAIFVVMFTYSYARLIVVRLLFLKRISLVLLQSKARFTYSIGFTKLFFLRIDEEYVVVTNFWDKLIIIVRQSSNSIYNFFKRLFAVCNFNSK